MNNVAIAFSPYTNSDGSNTVVKSELMCGSPEEPLTIDGILRYVGRMMEYDIFSIFTSSCLGVFVVIKDRSPGGVTRMFKVRSELFHSEIVPPTYSIDGDILVPVDFSTDQRSAVCFVGVEPEVLDMISAPVPSWAGFR